MAARALYAINVEDALWEGPPLQANVSDRVVAQSLFFVSCPCCCSARVLRARARRPVRIVLPHARA